MAFVASRGAWALLAVEECPNSFTRCSCSGHQYDSTYIASLRCFTQDRTASRMGCDNNLPLIFYLGCPVGWIVGYDFEK